VTQRTDGPSAAVRIRVYKRDRFTCTYCGVSGQEAELEVDHIIAVANGGSHHMSNLTTACRKCNQEKGVGKGNPKSRADVKQGASSHPLVGMFLHTFNDKGSIARQGKVVGVDDDVCLVQLYSWVDGGATEVVVLQKSYIYSDKVQLYSDHERWNYMADKAMKAERLKPLSVVK
jgi:hypothetical protein